MIKLREALGLKEFPVRNTKKGYAISRRGEGARSSPRRVGGFKGSQPFAEVLTGVQEEKERPIMDTIEAAEEGNGWLSRSAIILDHNNNNRPNSQPISQRSKEDNASAESSPRPILTSSHRIKVNSKALLSSERCRKMKVMKEIMGKKGAKKQRRKITWVCL